ncbi:MAG: SRPBCC family protein [Polyangiaceae bacterium]
MAKRNDTKEITITRIYDAPLKAVWDAWTDVEQVAKWWGPRGFTITTHGKDLRAGGFWDYTMHGPDKDWPNYTVYHQVEHQALLVYDHGGTKTTPPLFRVTAKFAAVEGGKKTKLEMSMEFESVEKARESRAFIKKAGGESTWDRLGEYLEKTIHGHERFLINRSFDAPIATMWKMWTTPEHVAKWTPPTGATMQFIEVDIRAGGKSRYSMTTDTGVVMYGRASYLELTEPNRIVYTQEFCDEKGNLSRHPFAPTWPATMLTTVTLTEEGPDCTRVTVSWAPHGNVTAEELATFVQARAGMTGGWTGSFDKLEAYLETSSHA